MFKIAAIASLLVLAAPGAAGAAGEGWVRPVPGAVAAPYTFDGVRFAAGRRRGVDFVARAGEPVRSPCAGTVTFSGTLPRFGAAVSVRCGRLTATVLGMSATAVKRGARLTGGERVGLAGPGGHVRLGARVTERAGGYVDPLALIGGGPRAAPRRTPVAVPLRGPAGSPPARLPAVHGFGPLSQLGASRDTTTPALAWVGLGLLAIGAGGSTVMRGSRRRSRAVRAARQQL